MKRTVSKQMLPLCFFFCLLVQLGMSQDSTTLALPDGYLASVEKRASALTGKLEKKAEKSLAVFQKREERLLRKLAQKDSTKAKDLLAASRQSYQQLQQSLNAGKPLQEYIPSLDTLSTSLKFLSQHKELLSKSHDVQRTLSKAFSNVEGLQSSLGKAETINQFLKQRQAQLIGQLKEKVFAKDFKKLYKQAYYYQAQVEEYKAALKDHKKLERKALELLSQTKAFQSFMRKNSQLASLFRLPRGEEEGTIASFEGLQTRAQVNNLLRERFGSNSAAIAQLRENVQAAQGQLASLKSKTESLKSASVANTSNDIQQPSFKPNSQKTKAFLRRLEVGTNIQTQKASWMFPVTSDLGLSLGYQLNDKSSLGVGGSYKLGLGTGWQHIAISHQGVGVRSYVEYQLKGSFFLSGGYEQNYRSEIKAIEQLKDRSAWQESGLVGLTKKYNVSKKIKGNMQLLWDFLSQRQVPRTQAVLFRVGYSLK